MLTYSFVGGLPPYNQPSSVESPEGVTALSSGPGAVVELPEPSSSVSSEEVVSLEAVKSVCHQRLCVEKSVGHLAVSSLMAITVAPPISETCKKFNNKQRNSKSEFLNITEEKMISP